MSFPALRRAALLTIGSTILAIGALLVADTLLNRYHAAAGIMRPLNQPAQGLVFDGMVVAPEGPCKGGYVLPESGFCTHGPDAAPDGVDVTQAADPTPLAARASGSGQCDGDGVSGYRTQVIYARASNNPNGDRYGTYLNSIRQWVAAADRLYSTSAALTGGTRNIRFVTDSLCNVSVLNVELSPAGDDTFDKTITELQAQGHNRADRKYLIFMDAKILCGVGTLYNDDRPGQENYNNGAFAGYARLDTACWNPNAIAHEHMHTLGGVQDSAPNSSGSSHCIDEYDVMCYVDSPSAPAIQYRCADFSFQDRFDCNNDDYFHTNPPAGSYLATHWNTANSRFLIDSGPVAPPSAAPTPSPTALPLASPSPSPSTAQPTPQPNAAAATFQVTLQVAGGGRIAPVVSGKYAEGQQLVAQAIADGGYLFVGWTLDGRDAGWANPLSLTVASEHTLVARFAPRPLFADVAAGDPAAEPIAQLAARGIIRGYDATTFGPGDQVLRAQMAALIARAMGWSGSAGTPFADRCDPLDPAACVDAELWDAVGQLASRDVARGYTDPAACAPAAAPCYAPRDAVLNAQVLSFITRAMVAKGYWQQQATDPNLYGGVLNGTGHEQDVATFIHYTISLGGVPDFPAGGDFAGWDQPASRAWFARTLWVALNSYLSVDRVP